MRLQSASIRSGCSMLKRHAGPAAARRWLGMAWIGLLLVALALLASAPAWAVEELPFQRPDGWLYEDAVSPGLRRVGREFETGHAAILASGPLPRDESLEGSLARVLAGLPGTASPPAAQGTGFTALGHRLAFEQREGTEGVLDAVALDDGTRRLVLLLQARALAPRFALRARDIFSAAVRSVRPGPDVPPVPPLVPAEGAGGLDGAFAGLHFDQRPNGDGDTETLLDTWVLLFDPAGLFSRVVPSAEGGVVTQCRARPQDCGTYGLRGGGWLRPPSGIWLREGSERYGMIETRKFPFAQRDMALQIGTTRLDPEALLPPGTLLEGHWSMLSVSSGKAVRRDLMLKHDGRFRRDLEENEFAQGITTSSSAGRYRVEGHRLLLEADDGQRESLGLLQPDRNTDAVLLIDGEFYLKRAADPLITE